MVPPTTRNGSEPICYQFRDTGSCSYGTSCRFHHVGDPTHNARHPGGKKDSDAISAFFARYPGFAYDDEQGVAEEFYRMCDFFAWNRDDDERHEARQAFKDALVIQFNSLYGTDVSDIENWHKLCIAVFIEPLPVTIPECKKEIEKIHVNLVDLVDVSRRGVKLFPSLAALRVYTIETGKFFPKESAYAGGVLRFLLREIL
ncbi:hypothetical protein P153DRAFT_422521 [Dothidotthia symphoricarpi CBS 119687]|uniref:C3H1-type domain-containing protein n=1 Tax=Dothidotthia symphoricarpi CBS 119687 TaxID=1392245 RepID=A0A6A6AF22_9PLEO|nr:hypothetical protein P153DRAFT_422521 [Dothidotthia symphoricarpi CBS 119687]